MKKPLLLLLLTGTLAACGSNPSAPDWPAHAQAGAERSTQAWLTGDSRVEAAEFARARREVARTGRPDLVARLELLRCAARVAALDVAPCTGFDRLATDASAIELAYARYLAGRAAADDVEQLPAPHRPLVRGLAAPEATLAAIDDPLSRLVAAGVLFRRDQATPAVIGLAIDTASAQGWRRPLLAWLKVQQARAQAAGVADEVARIQRRIDLVVPAPP